MLNKLVEGKGGYFYSIFRILVGLMFIQHGAQKLFGLLGGNAAPLISRFGLAGIIEFFGGLLIILGLFTRFAALIAGLEMLTAYFMAHAPQGLFPIMNKGELAVMFFAAFLVIFAHGAKKWSLERIIFKKEF